MNKIILISLSLIAAVGVIATGATISYFSDVETSTGNTFSAGTIDIAVNDENPWNGTGYFTIEDMKPCDVEYKTFTITNVGQNEVDVWKHLEVVSTDTGKTVYPDPITGPVSSEPEYVAEGAVYDPVTKIWDTTNFIPVDDISKVITYDLIVDGEVIIDGADHVKIFDIACYWMYLGKIEPGATMEVIQSYHLQGIDAGNEYQGDKMNFEIELLAQQIRGCPPAPTPELTGYEKPDGKYVNIGDPISERGHINRDVDDWSYVGSQSCVGGPSAGCLKLGGYGGYDGGSANFRGLMGPPTGCNGDPSHTHAVLVMNACDGEVTQLTLRHLDGSQDDSFDVFIKKDGSWQLIGHYDWQNSTEFWTTTSFDLPEPRIGKIEFKLVATDPETPWCNQGWGQVMINWVQIQ